jgi:hypothetical protein
MDHVNGQWFWITAISVKHTQPITTLKANFSYDRLHGFLVMMTKGLHCLLDERQ